MRSDQKIAVARVSRRKLNRHAAALRASVAVARHELAADVLDAEARERLRGTILRVEREIARLEEAAATAPPADDPDAPLLYNAAARD